jgi:hypothetical protein
MLEKLFKQPPKFFTGWAKSSPMTGLKKDQSGLPI